MGPKGRSGQIFEIFQILGETGDINNSISMPNYCDGPYCDLGMYVDKVLSAWNELCTCAWPSRSSILAPGVAFWADFRDF